MRFRVALILAIAAAPGTARAEWTSQNLPRHVALAQIDPNAVTVDRHRQWSLCRGETPGQRYYRPANVRRGGGAWRIEDRR